MTSRSKIKFVDILGLRPKDCDRAGRVFCPDRKFHLFSANKKLFSQYLERRSTNKPLITSIDVKQMSNYRSKFQQGHLKILGLNPFCPSLKVRQTFSLSLPFERKEKTTGSLLDSPTRQVGWDWAYPTKCFTFWCSLVWQKKKFGFNRKTIVFVLCLTL